MDFLRRSYEYFHDLLSRKRRRASPKSENLVNLKRKKIDFNNIQESQVSPYQVTNHLKYTPLPPMRQSKTPFEINDPRSLYRAFVSSTDENSPEILSSKLHLMRQALEFGEIALKKQNKFPNRASAKDRKADGSDQVEKVESCHSWKTSEIEPNSDFSEILLLKQNERIKRHSLRDRLDEVLQSMEKIEPYPSWENSKIEASPMTGIESFVKEMG